jgi:hypothetical protein
MSFEQKAWQVPVCQGLLRSISAGWAFLLVLCLAAPFAQASKEESPERVAKKACLAGEFAKGVSILADLPAGVWGHAEHQQWVEVYCHRAWHR